MAQRKLAVLTIVTDENLAELLERPDIVKVFTEALEAHNGRQVLVEQVGGWFEDPKNGFRRPESWWDSPAVQQRMGDMARNGYAGYREFLDENGSGYGVERIMHFFENLYYVILNRSFGQPDTDRYFEHTPPEEIEAILSWLERHPVTPPKTEYTK